MALSFTEQLVSADQVLEGTGQVVLCLGSGISRRKLPLLAGLIARAFLNLPLNEDANQIFEGYSQTHVFHLRLSDRGLHSSTPCTLDEFRTLLPDVQAAICQPLAQIYGDVFRDLETVYGSKQEMLAAIDIGQFQTAEPDVAHFYIAYLLIEGRISRVLTTNWDVLIEKALAASTSKPADHFLSIAQDDATWLDRLNQHNSILTKVHGCATQYPDSCEQIIITTRDLLAATANGWRQQAVQEFLSGRVLFSGYSGSDYTLMVPAKVIQAMRAQHALTAAEYFVAQEGDLSHGALQLNGNQPNKHLQMYANDTFTSLYFSFLRKRFKQALEVAAQQTQPERAFSRWSDDAWNEMLIRLHVLMDDDFPKFLDYIIGLPGSRPYDDSIGILPVRLSELREMFLEGTVQHPRSYQPLRFDPLKDLVLLILIAAFFDLGACAGLSFSAKGEIAGITFVESTGTVRTACFVYGTYAPAAVPMVTNYLNDIEASYGILPTYEVLIVPCSQYHVGAVGTPTPRPVLSKSLPGSTTATRTFVNPDIIFHSTDFNDLGAKLRIKLGV